MAVAGRCTTAPIAAVPAIDGTGRSGRRSARSCPTGHASRMSGLARSSDLGPVSSPPLQRGLGRSRGPFGRDRGGPHGRANVDRQAAFPDWLDWYNYHRPTPESAATPSQPRHHCPNSTPSSYSLASTGASALTTPPVPFPPVLLACRRRLDRSPAGVVRPPSRWQPPRSGRGRRSGTARARRRRSLRPSSGR